MSKSIAHMRYPLDGVFAASSRTSVLRTLLYSKEGMSGRAIARMAGINPQTCLNAVQSLEILEILRREGTGQSQLVKLNRENYIVKELLVPLLIKEKGFLGVLEEELLNILIEENGRKSMSNPLSATIFGSYARKENRPESDLDILITVDNAKRKNVLESKFFRFQSSFKVKFGVRMAPIVLTVMEAKRRLKKSDPLINSILREGVDVMPKKLIEIIS